MASYHHTTVMGNITRDIELRHTQGGTAVCDVSVAVNDRIKSGDEWKDKTTYYECVLWGKIAETAQRYLRKGAPVLVAGKMQTESWEKDGQRRSKMVLKVETMQLLGGKPQGGERSEPSATTHDEPVNVGAQDDDIPF